ncbi:hypothetical protein EOI87_24100 [Salmonella enterica]|nr:hypothetical protein [Salmonella enterica]EBQ2130827.1 hypothetical protein [Salmonella enterica]EBT1279107.1 hypothetical protein [Salmonella enterica]MIV19369.1 hypothetical protein [Salmonella enterica]
MSEHKRPVLSISGKRKPSLMYQKQKPDSEQSAAQMEQQAQTVTASSTKAKPKYKGLPEWREVLRDRADLLYSRIPLTGKPKKNAPYYGKSGRADKVMPAPDKPQSDNNSGK